MSSADLQTTDCTILVVGDKATIRRLVTAALASAGFIVLWATGVEHATEVFLRQASRVDLLVTDVAISGGSGPLLARRLRGFRTNLKVLFISVYDREALISVLPPESQFLQMPFEQEHLVSKARELLSWRGQP